MSTDPDNRMFVKYSLFKVSSDWKRLPEEEKENSKIEFSELLAEFDDKIYSATYSTVGTRGDVDLVIWNVSESLELLLSLIHI